MCRGCHVTIFEQHSESMHAKSFTNPVFQAQYFNEVLPMVGKDPDIRFDTVKCIACHSPIAYIKNGGEIDSPEQADLSMSGVTCDFCHRISGYQGDGPEDGNFIATPGEIKYGPFRYEADHHREYHELQTKSELCAICHNSVNHHGLEIKSTYTEWRNSTYAEKGIECQDCHMNAKGFLTGGKPYYASGKAAKMTLGRAPYRRKLYTHRFPGAHSKTQVKGAITLKIEVEKTAVSAGEDVTITIYVDNSRTGHKMPSGSADLRQLWLDLKVKSGMKELSVPAVSDIKPVKYDIAGEGPFDREVLGDDIRQGCRIYRTILMDETGKQTLSSYNAVKIIFDNRLNSSETRKETYRFKTPEDAEGHVIIVAKLNYLSFPSSFAKSLGVPARSPVEISTAIKKIKIR